MTVAVGVAWLDVGLVVAGIGYAAISLVLFVVGANLVWFAASVVRSGRRPPADPPLPRELPRVTVQLPIYNELYVARRAIEAACALRYPAHLLQVQVLDDSTDETVSVVAAAVAEARAGGIDVEHVRRAGRSGYKAGALAHGLGHATGEFVVVLDADFVPDPDLLERTLGWFVDEQVAFVQCRWGHLNRDQTLLTRLQSLAIDGHFLVEQDGRHHRGAWFNFNGTAGVWRVAAIRDAGGWTADTLTEDLDLSYRAHLRGWRGRFLRHVVVPGELPVEMAAFRRQQHRWARGSLEVAAKLLPSVWRSGAGLGVRFQATAHLLAYGVHVLLAALTLGYPLVVLLRARVDGVEPLFVVGSLFVLTSLSPAIVFATAQHQQGRAWLRQLPLVVAAGVLGSGLMLNTVRAAWQIRTRPDAPFERTAKLGLDGATAEGWTRRRYLVGSDRIVWAEFALGAYAWASAALAVAHGNWGVVVFASLFGTGLIGVAGITVAQAAQVRRHRWAVPSPVPAGVS